MRYHNITKDDMLNGDGLRAVLRLELVECALIHGRHLAEMWIRCLIVILVHTILKSIKFWILFIHCLDLMRW